MLTLLLLPTEQHLGGKPLVLVARFRILWVARRDRIPIRGVGLGRGLPSSMLVFLLWVLWVVCVS